MSGGKCLKRQCLCLFARNHRHAPSAANGWSARLNVGHWILHHSREESKLPWKYDAWDRTFLFIENCKCFSNVAFARNSQRNEDKLKKHSSFARIWSTHKNDHCIRCENLVPLVLSAIYSRVVVSDGCMIITEWITQSCRCLHVFELIESFMNIGLSWLPPVIPLLVRWKPKKGEKKTEKGISCLHAHDRLNNLKEFMISIYFEVFRMAFTFDPKCFQSAIHSDQKAAPNHSAAENTQTIFESCIKNVENLVALDDA